MISRPFLWSEIPGARASSLALWRHFSLSTNAGKVYNEHVLFWLQLQCTRHQPFLYRNFHLICEIFESNRRLKCFNSVPSKWSPFWGRRILSQFSYCAISRLSPWLIRQVHLVEIKLFFLHSAEEVTIPWRKLRGTGLWPALMRLQKPWFCP